MSRKKNKQAMPADTGGLDLTLPITSTDGDILATSGDIVLSMHQAPESRAHAAMEELESLPQMAAPPEIITDIVFANAMPLAEALHQSPFIWMAAAKTNVEGCLLLSNGSRHWTVSANTFEPALFDGARYDASVMRNQKVWRPVLGSERGWYVSEAQLQP